MTAAAIDGTSRVRGLEVRHVVLPLAAPYRSAGTVLERREALLVHLRVDGAAGWGECSPVPGYSAEGLAGCRELLWSRLDAAVGTSVDDPEAVGASLGPAPPSVRHALETAAWDALGRLRRVSLAALLGGSPGPVPAGAVLGLTAGPEELLLLAAAGYARLKLKVAGAGDLPRIAELRAGLDEAVPLAIDANGSLDPDDIGGLADRLDALHLAFVEQPFPADDLASAAGLQRTGRTPLCLDESITGPETARRALTAGAARSIVLKPARLGGMAAALRTLAAAQGAGGTAWVGGMLETGIGRAASLALARGGRTGLPADLSPPTVYLQRDVVIGSFRFDHLGVHTPPGPGLGVEVDRDAVDDTTVEVARAGSF